MYHLYRYSAVAGLYFEYLYTLQYYTAYAAPICVYISCHLNHLFIHKALTSSIMRPIVIPRAIILFDLSFLFSGISGLYNFATYNQGPRLHTALVQTLAV